MFNNQVVRTGLGNFPPLLSVEDCWQYYIERASTILPHSSSSLILPFIGPHFLLFLLLLHTAQPKEMSNSNQRDIPVAYPPPPASQTTYLKAPPPIGYPTKDGSDQEGGSSHPIPAETTSRGEGFWKGCVAALCCCWVLDFCCG